MKKIREINLGHNKITYTKLLNNNTYFTIVGNATNLDSIVDVFMQVYILEAQEMTSPLR